MYHKNFNYNYILLTNFCHEILVINQCSAHVGISQLDQLYKRPLFCHLHNYNFIKGNLFITFKHHVNKCTIRTF